MQPATIDDDKCRTCDGRGRWQEREQDTEGEYLVWRECNDCGGTGHSKDAVPDFDADGESYQDD